MWGIGGIIGVYGRGGVIRKGRDWGVFGSEGVVKDFKEMLLCVLLE